MFLLRHVVGKLVQIFKVENHLAGLHHPIFCLKNAQIGVTPPGDVLPVAGKIVGRIIELYNTVLDMPKGDGSDPESGAMWDHITGRYFLDVHEALKARDVDAVARIMAEPDETDIFFGFDILAKSYKDILKGQRNQRSYAQKCFDDLIMFAQAIGAVEFFNPESPLLQYDPEEVFAAIETTLGVRIELPTPYPREYGLRISRGVVSYRAVQAMFQAYRIHELTKGVKNPSVVEIGAGLGRTAYYARTLFGIKDYRIVDIPSTMISQAHFLATCLGEDAVVLYGEDVDGKAAKDKVKILPPEAFLNEDGRYDLILNFDSMTEMDQGIAEAYWDKSFEVSPMLLSVNHERNDFRVLDIIRGSNKVASFTRNPYWMRKGYVEEVIEFFDDQGELK